MAKPVFFVLPDGTEVQLRRPVGLARALEIEPVPDNADAVGAQGISTRRDDTIHWVDWRIIGRR